MRDYEEGNMEDGDSGGDIHSDGGTDRNGNQFVRGRANALVKSEKLKVKSEE